MTSPSPLFIPLKKGKECFAVQSWRESPSLKPTPPTPTDGPMQAPTCSLSPEESKGRRKKGGKGKLQQDEGFDDFILKCAITGVLGAEVENYLAEEDAKPQRVMDIGAPRTAPLKRVDDVEGYHDEAALALDELGGSFDGGMGALPEMTLPPSMPTSALETENFIAMLFGEQEVAERAMKLIAKKWQNAATEMTTRRRSVLNASLVIKGLPFTTNCEKLVEELDKLRHKPSYVRMHRSERGVFKCVVFVKFSSRGAAEHSKLELERLIVGSRPLKVEFKKKYREQDSKAAQLANLEQAVRELRASREHEGFLYNRSSISKEEVKYLKHLCLSYDLLFDATADSIAVKRRVVSDTKNTKSPAMRPTATSSWAPATPGSLLPMDFRGIRHWKEVRQGSASSNSLAIVRPQGPGDVPPFGAGRGRPI